MSRIACRLCPQIRNYRLIESFRLEYQVITLILKITEHTFYRIFTNIIWKVILDKRSSVLDTFCIRHIYNNRFETIAGLLS